MLGDWISHADYQHYLLSVLLVFLDTDRDRLYSLESSISKLYLLDLDKVYPVIEGLYPGTGRPAKNQQAYYTLFGTYARSKG